MISFLDTIASSPFDVIFRVPSPVNIRFEFVNSAPSISLVSSFNP